MIEVINHGVLLRATKEPFESFAVLNPGCLLVDDILHMTYRAIAPGNYSTIGYAQFKDHQLLYRAKEPLLKIEHPFEQHGLEDPRLVYCEGTYYLFYVVYDGANTQVAYATADTLPAFTKQTVISSQLSYKKIQAVCRSKADNINYQYFCQRYLNVSPEQGQKLLWEKDSFIFPRKFASKFALVYRFFPEIRVIYFTDFHELTTDYWLNDFASGQDKTILAPHFPFENLFIGGGCPPVETADGWLLVYHAVSESNGKQSYQAAVALLDRDDPTHILGQLPYPLFTPNHSWEQEGNVSNVVFPTGAVSQNGRLFIYYGAADSEIAYCSVEIDNLLAELHKHPVH